MLVMMYPEHTTAVQESGQLEVLQMGQQQR